MRIQVPTNAAQAARLRQWRDQFQAGADYVRDHPTPTDIDPELWPVWADACQSMVEEMDDALAAFARGVRMP